MSSNHPNVLSATPMKKPKTTINAKAIQGNITTRYPMCEAGVINNKCISEAVLKQIILYYSFLLDHDSSLNGCSNYL